MAHNRESHNGLIGDGGQTPKVVALGIVGEGHIALGNGHTLKVAQAYPHCVNSV